MRTSISNRLSARALAALVVLGTAGPAAAQVGDRQLLASGGGDPYVGAKLHRYFQEAGFSKVVVNPVQMPNDTSDASQMKEALFGSDLSYEDVIENFFAWNRQAIVGNETINRVDCTIHPFKA